MVAPKAIALVVIFALAGCQTLGGSFCDIDRPNRNPVEDMTSAEARTALAHNLKGAELCGWQP